MNTNDHNQNTSDNIPKGTVQIPLDTLDEIENQSPLSPDEVSENGVSGPTADPESDDDMLQNEHEVGLYTDADEDEAPELNIADQIEKAEKYHHDH